MGHHKIMSCKQKCIINLFRPIKYNQIFKVSSDSNEDSVSERQIWNPKSKTKNEHNLDNP